MLCQPSAYDFQIPAEDSMAPKPKVITYISHRECFFYYDFHLRPRMNVTCQSEKQEQL